MYWVIMLIIFLSCFPHITNLACKAVLAAVTDLAKAAVTENEMLPEYEPVHTGPSRDIIAHVRLVVRVVRHNLIITWEVY